MKKIIATVLLMTLVFSMVYAETDEPSSWAVESIEEISNLNILDETFFGNYKSNITRQEFAYLGVKLYEFYTGRTVSIGEASFTDTEDEWALKAKNAGIVGGYPDGSFKPDQLITRQELAVLFVNTLKASEVEYLTPDAYLFKDDSDIFNWAKSSVYTAKANGIVNGVGNDLYNPGGYATKEQSLVMFRNGQTSSQIVYNADKEKAVLVMYSSEF